MKRSDGKALWRLAHGVRAAHDEEVEADGRSTMPVRMELSRIFIREMTDMQIIELSEVDGDRTFPIVIGLPEAFAIDRRLKNIEIIRPQTHDLLAAVITQLGGMLKSILINDLSNQTFYARLIIDQDGEIIEVDSRPSDAIAIGIAEDVPIYVAEHVLAQVEKDNTDGPTAFEFDDDELNDEDDDEPLFENDWE